MLAQRLHEFTCACTHNTHNIQSWIGMYHAMLPLLANLCHILTVLTLSISRHAHLPALMSEKLLLVTTFTVMSHLCSKIMQHYVTIVWSLWHEKYFSDIAWLQSVSSSGGFLSEQIRKFELFSGYSLKSVSEGHLSFWDLEYSHRSCWHIHDITPELLLIIGPDQWSCIITGSRLKKIGYKQLDGFLIGSKVTIYILFSSIEVSKYNELDLS